MDCGGRRKKRNGGGCDQNVASDADSPSPPLEFLQSTPRCGEDITPLHGTGCEGGPPVQTVCGTCGILFDNTMPIIAGKGQMSAERRSMAKVDVADTA